MNDNQFVNSEYTVAKCQAALTIAVDQAFKKAAGANYDEMQSKAAHSILINAFKAAEATDKSARQNHTDIAYLAESGNMTLQVAYNKMSEYAKQTQAINADLLAALEAIEAYEDDEPAAGTRGAEIAAMRRAAIAKAQS